jgi:hypothetical protein
LAVLLAKSDFNPVLARWLAHLQAKRSRLPHLWSEGVHPARSAQQYLNGGLD